MFRVTFQGQPWEHEVASTAKCQMSALGHKATWRESAMSFIPPKADIRQRGWYVRLVRLKRGNADDVEDRPRAGPFLRWCSADFSGRVPLAYDPPRLG